MKKKWDEYKTYENWKSKNEYILRPDYEEYKSNYMPGDECDGVRSFDDYCMGQWQRLD